MMTVVYVTDGSLLLSYHAVLGDDASSTQA
jgi:hypothetical protein